MWPASPVPQQHGNSTKRSATYANPMYSLTLRIENNIAEQCVETKMKYIVHKKSTSLTPIAQAIRDVFQIKLTRAKERHAEAMGFNTFNHLSEAVKASDVKIGLDEYTIALADSILKNHDIVITDNQKEILEERLKCEINIDGIAIYFYELKFRRPDEFDIDYIESKLKLDSTLSTIVLSNNDEYENGYGDFSRIVNGKPTLIISALNSNMMMSSDGPLIIVSTNELGDLHVPDHLSINLCKKEIFPFKFNHSGRVSKRNIGEFAETFCKSVDFLSKSIIEREMKNEGFIICTMLDYELSPEGALDRLNEAYLRYFIENSPNDEYCPCYGAAVDFKNKASMTTGCLADIYEWDFNGEVIERFADFYLDIESILYKNGFEYRVNMESISYDVKGSPHEYVYINNLRDLKKEGKSLPLIRKRNLDLNMDLLVEILLINDASVIYAHSGIRHNCGNDVIFGCTAIDDKNNISCRFQIFAPSAHVFYHEFLPKLKEKTKILSFEVTKNLEYDLESEEVDLLLDDDTTFSFPHGAEKRQKLGFILLKVDNFNSLSNTSSFNLYDHPDAIKEIQHNHRRAVIYHPVRMPVDISNWHYLTRPIIDSLTKSNSLSPDRLRTEMIRSFNQNLGPVILASPVIFDLAEDDYADLILMLGGAMTEINNLKPIERAMNLKIESCSIFLHPDEYNLY